MKLQFYIEEMKMKQYYMHLKEYSKYQEKILKKLYGKTTKANQRFSDIVNLVRPLTKEDKEIIFKTLQEETDCKYTIDELFKLYDINHSIKTEKNELLRRIKICVALNTQGKNSNQTIESLVKKNKDTDFNISRRQLSYYMDGNNLNGSDKQVQKLAGFFNVIPEYFMKDKFKEFPVPIDYSFEYMLDAEDALRKEREREEKKIMDSLSRFLILCSDYTFEDEGLRKDYVSKLKEDSTMIKIIYATVRYIEYKYYKSKNIDHLFNKKNIYKNCLYREGKQPLSDFDYMMYHQKQLEVGLDMIKLRLVDYKELLSILPFSSFKLKINNEEEFITILESELNKCSKNIEDFLNSFYNDIF